MFRDASPLPRTDDDAYLMSRSSGGAGDEVPTPSPQPDPNSLDDVFGSAPASPTLASDLNIHDATEDDVFAARRGESRSRNHHHPSDIPRLRSTHVTNGYREGLAGSKERFVQEGFDEGYGLGGEVGLRAGRVLGVLEGVYAALVREGEGERKGKGEGEEEGKGGRGEGASEGGEEPGEWEELRRDVEEVLARAREELSVRNLLGPEYFGPEGIWKYTVAGSEEQRLADGEGVGAEKGEAKSGGDGEIRASFKEVAACHPVLRKWTSEVERVVERIGLFVR